ncbi:FANCL C-terminal domain-containing protein, partial [Scenedesmus sp. NREL 46B-D3]
QFSQCLHVSLVQLLLQCGCCLAVAGEAPSVTCPGASCSRAFHAMCLAEWLGALPTSRRVFDTLFGSCPFCNGPIGVSTRPVAH